MLIKRIGYYLVGLSIGCVGVYFFWQKKKATFEYGMDARTLKSIRIKDRMYSKDAESAMYKFNIDTLNISTILYTGDVDFGKSNQRKEPCAEYYITGKKELENFSLYVTRCDSIATIEKIYIN